MQLHSMQSQKADPAIKKSEEGNCEKRCDIQGGCDGRLMTKKLITTIQVNLMKKMHLNYHY